MNHSDIKVNIPTTEVITIVYSCSCVVLMTLHRSSLSATHCFKMLILRHSISLADHVTFSLDRSSVGSRSMSKESCSASSYLSHPTGSQSLQLYLSQHYTSCSQYLHLFHQFWILFISNIPSYLFHHPRSTDCVHGEYSPMSLVQIHHVSPQPFSKSHTVA